jgi:hypothetical protein
MKFRAYYLVVAFVLCFYAAESTAAWKMYMISGQSNASGYCTDSSWSGEAVEGTAFEYRYRRVEYTRDTLTHAILDSAVLWVDTLVPLDDPMGRASPGFSRSNTGSMAPRFCERYYQLTGDSLIMIHTARMATGLHTKSGTPKRWLSQDHDTTMLLPLCMNIVNAAMAKAGRSLDGILWCQGEADAVAINRDTLTQAEYKSALIAFIDTFRVLLSNPKLPFYVIQTGTLNRDCNGGDSALYDTLAFGRDSTDYGFAKVREAQTQVCADDTFTVMVHNRAVEFAEYTDTTKTPPDCFMWDTWHYSNLGQREIGWVSAENIVKYQQYGQDLAVPSTAVRHEPGLGLHAAAPQKARRPEYRIICSESGRRISASGCVLYDIRGRLLPKNINAKLPDGIVIIK